MHQKKINSWKDITIEIDSTIDYNLETSGAIHFRGQSKSKWKLESSLMRLIKNDEISEKKALYYENESILEFNSQSHLFDITNLNSKQPSRISFLMNMQHFSCPTRLLDWSSSPYVALYFAVNEDFDEDGALFFWDYLRYNDKMEKNYSGYKKIKSNHILSHEDYDMIQILYSLRKNNRIVKQQGVFSISNNPLRSHCDIINEAFQNNEPSGLFKIIIPKEMKLEFLGRLRAMNISAESLFPGLDGLGKSIREKMFLRKWKKK